MKSISLRRKLQPDWPQFKALKYYSGSTSEEINELYVLEATYRKYIQILLQDCAHLALAQ